MYNDKSDDLIHLFLSTGGEHPAAVCVRKWEPVSVLRERTGIPQSSLVCRGRALSETLTFDSQNVENNDRIVCIPKGSGNSALQFWIHATCQSSEQCERASLATDRSSKVELARLSDLAMFKVETRPAAFRRVLRNYIAFSKGEIRWDFKTNIEYDQPQGPSTQSMPVLLEQRSS